MSTGDLARRVRRTIRIWAIRFGLWLGGVLPFRAAWALGGLIGLAAWKLGGVERQRVRENLAFALPGLSDEERRRIEREVFLHFGHGGAEVAQMARLDRRLERYVTYAPGSEELLHAAVASGRGAVLVTGHMGSWELLARRMARSGFSPLVIAARSWDRRLDHLVERFRANGGVRTLYREDPASGRILLKEMRAGAQLGVLIDQDTKVQSVFVPFFGALAATPRAPADLALRFGSVLLVGWSRRRGPRPGDGYELVVESVPYDPSPSDKDAEVTRVIAHCTARLEAAIRQAPAEWVWMHRRWRTRPPDSA